jgi:hypothetical protein
MKDIIRGQKTHTLDHARRKCSWPNFWQLPGFDRDDAYDPALVTLVWRELRKPRSRLHIIKIFVSKSKRKIVTKNTMKSVSSCEPRYDSYVVLRH